jgi:hypothetical protein
MKKLPCILALFLAGCAPLPAQILPLSLNLTSGQVVTSRGAPANAMFSNLTVTGSINGNMTGGGGGSGNYSGNFTGGNIAGLLLGNTTVTPEAVGNTSLAPVSFNVLSGNYNTAATEAAIYAPLNSPTFTGNGQLSGNFLVGGNVSGTWNGTNLTENQVTNLTSNLSALAPLASPGFTGGPSVTGNLAVSGNSSALNFNGTNAFFTNITAPNLDVTGNLSFGAISNVVPGNGTNAALAVNGSILSVGYGNSFLINQGNLTQINTIATGNVLGVWNNCTTGDYGDSALAYYNHAGNQVGAVGYGTHSPSADSYGHRMFIAASMPYTPSNTTSDPSPPTFATTPTGLVFSQEYYYHNSWAQVPVMLFDEEGQMHMGLPGGENWLDCFTPSYDSGADYNSPYVLMELSGNTAGDSPFVGIGMQLTQGGSWGTGRTFDIFINSASYHAAHTAFPSNGATYISENGGGGQAFILSSSAAAGSAFTWVTGGIDASNTKMQLDYGGNLTLGTTTPAPNALLTVAGDAAMSGNITLAGNVTDTSSAGIPQGVLVTSTNASGTPFFAAHASGGKAFDMEMPTYNGTAVAMFISNTTQQQFVSDADGSSINFIVGDTYQNDTLQVNGANIAVSGNASVSGNLTTASGPPFAITGNNTTTLFITINGIARNITFAP